jgi:hypothetical protein
MEDGFDTRRTRRLTITTGLVHFGFRQPGGCNPKAVPSRIIPQFAVWLVPRGASIPIDWIDFGRVSFYTSRHAFPVYTTYFSSENPIIQAW